MDRRLSGGISPHIAGLTKIGRDENRPDKREKARIFLDEIDDDRRIERDGSRAEIV